MPFLSDFHENKIGDHMYRNVAYTPPATIYLSLHTASPGDTGAAEVTGGSYARQAITLAAFAGGLGDNTAIIDFAGMPAVGGDGVVGFGIWDAVTVGNLLSWGYLQVSGGFKKLCVVEDADLVANDITSPGHALVVDNRVVFASIAGSTLPTGITAGTIYWVRTGPTADTFQIATTQGGAAVDITAIGSGLLVKVANKTVNAGDTFRFPVGDIDVIFE